VTRFDEAVDITVSAAEDVLGMEVAGLYAPAADNPDQMVPVAATKGIETLFDESPTIQRGEGLVWRVYESEQPIFAADVREYPEASNAETPIRSEILLPVGDHGVFVAGATTTDGFDTTDKKMAHVLVATLRRALERGVIG